MKEGEAGYKDWVFINYTYKRFEGLTQRGLVRPSKQKWASLRTFTCDRRQKEGCGNERPTISSRTFGDDRRWLIFKQGKRMVSHFYLFYIKRTENNLPWLAAAMLFTGILLCLLSSSVGLQAFLAFIFFWYIQCAIDSLNHFVNPQVRLWKLRLWISKNLPLSGLLLKIAVIGI